MELLMKSFAELRETIRHTGLPMLDTGLAKQIRIQEAVDAAEKEFKDIHKNNRLGKEHTQFAKRYKFGVVPGQVPGQEFDESRFVNGMLKRHYDDKYNGSFYGTHGPQGRQMVQGLDNALNSASTDRDMTVFTGLRTKPKTNAQGVAHMPHYVSTSLDHKIAAHFTDMQGDGEGHILQIDMPKGTKAASLNHIKSSTGPKEFDNEHEMLLHRGHHIAIDPTPEKMVHGGKTYNVWKGRIAGHAPQEITKKFQGQAGADESEYRKVQENFKDGRRPQDRGDSARHGLKGKSAAELRSIRSSDSASPRKKQLAHWLLNFHHNKK